MERNAMTIFKNALEVYSYLCAPICKKYDIQQPALDILVFLNKNPDANTAVDIQKQEGIKQSMVSFHVDRLVNDGYIERLSVPEDRRKIKLICTEKALPLIEECKNVREKMWNDLTEGLSKEEIKLYETVSMTISNNISACRERMQKGEFK